MYIQVHTICCTDISAELPRNTFRHCVYTFSANSDQQVHDPRTTQRLRSAIANGGVPRLPVYARYTLLFVFL